MAPPDPFEERMLFAREMIRSSLEYAAALRPMDPSRDSFAAIRETRATSRSLIEQARALCLLSDALRSASRAIREGR